MFTLHTWAVALLNDLPRCFWFRYFPVPSTVAAAGKWEPSALISTTETLSSSYQIS
jgi:hypothetical protein